MSANDLPKMVPLPEVENYTDAIIVRDVGLPYGFDSERLLFGLRAMERVRTAVGLGTITVTAAYAEQAAVTPGKLDASGTMTLGRISFGGSSEPPLGSVKLELDRPANGKADPWLVRNEAALTAKRARQAAFIRLDLRQRDQRIARAKKYDGVMDPTAQADFLHYGIKEALYEANRRASIDGDSLRFAAGFYGVFGAMSAAFYNTHMQELTAFPVVASLAYPLWDLAMHKTDLERESRQSSDESAKLTWKEAAARYLQDRRFTMLVGPTWDRYVLGLTSLARAGRLVKTTE